MSWKSDPRGAERDPPPLRKTSVNGRLSKKGQTMLILRRKIGERIVIDGHIEVTVLQVRGGKVRLGFNAPRSVRVLRQEVLQPESESALDDAAAVEVEMPVT